MKLRFNIHFHTSSGQKLFIIGSIHELGKWDMEQAKEMFHLGDGIWYVELNIPNEVFLLYYRYFLKSGEGKLTFEEWKHPHYVRLNNHYKNYYIWDFWQLNPQYRVFYSSAFTKNWFARHDEHIIVPIYKRTIRIKISAPLVAPNERVVLLGNSEALGNWIPEKALSLSCEKFPDWQIDLDADKLPKTFEYKFCIIDEEKKSFLRWELGENRCVNVPILEKDETFIISSLYFRDKDPEWKCAGVVIPVFSLKTNNSFGIGDFGDLLQIIDWVRITNQKIIQILPINDTTNGHTWKDSYPYNIISAYALHPIYLNLKAMGTLKNSERDTFYKSKQAELNKSPVVNYKEVDKWKWEFFREIFRQDGEGVLSSCEFVSFFKENQEWLIPYANYCHIRDERDSTFSQQERYIPCHDFQLPQYKFYYYLQFHAHKQLKKVSNYARQNKIVLKGDIPVGVHREGVETWIKPDYFNMHFQVGAPPDTFSGEGQVWGFPVCNWKKIELDNYSWWKKRLQKMADYFDAYRIDHILGFFRIWQIPENFSNGSLGYFSPALPLCIEEIKRWGLPFCKKTKELFIEDLDKKGYYHPRILARHTLIYKQLNQNHQKSFDHLYNDYFYQRNNELWKLIALKHLTQIVDFTDMLVCGEDLGMIPHSVPEVMNTLQILSLEIERIPKSSGQEFTDLNCVPYFSVCTTSTHDMAPIRLWWKEDEKQTQHYYNRVLKKEGTAPKDCTPKISESIICNHLNAKSMLVIIPLQDWLSIDAQLRNSNPDTERINNPTNPCHHWQYRMHLTIEDLLEAENLNTKICSLIHRSYRTQP
ncbi:MAG: 4-alpha-glucanotransferase [Candidatus Azobacteroides pseudotrichonymphae]|nr:4-alpha-glucanotransferase [Bacteroidales bacterium OttesenSCG-928-I14]GMO34746.1 MAG: 4-alpha-glucanotransferase [Candidatus Azobacteroides pseudotrichonymphae]